MVKKKYSRAETEKIMMPARDIIYTSNDDIYGPPGHTGLNPGQGGGGAPGQTGQNPGHGNKPKN